jgi:hypothetical protein
VRPASAGGRDRTADRHSFRPVGRRSGCPRGLFDPAVGRNRARRGQANPNCHYRPTRPCSTRLCSARRGLRAARVPAVGVPGRPCSARRGSGPPGFWRLPAPPLPSVPPEAAEAARRRLYDEAVRRGRERDRQRQGGHRQRHRPAPAATCGRPAHAADPRSPTGAPDGTRTRSRPATPPPGRATTPYRSSASAARPGGCTVAAWAAPHAARRACVRTGACARAAARM